MSDWEKDAAAFTVRQLIEALTALPQDARVSMLWDGEARTHVEAAWLARSGNVVLGPLDEPVYDNEDRTESTPPNTGILDCSVKSMLTAREGKAHD